MPSAFIKLPNWWILGFCRIHQNHCFLDVKINIVKQNDFFWHFFSKKWKFWRNSSNWWKHQSPHTFYFFDFCLFCGFDFFTKAHTLFVCSWSSKNTCNLVNKHHLWFLEKIIKKRKICLKVWKQKKSLILQCVFAKSDKNVDQNSTKNTIFSENVVFQRVVMLSKVEELQRFRLQSTKSHQKKQSNDLIVNFKDDCLFCLL